MSILSEVTDPRTGVSFALDRMDLEDGVVSVTGRWSEVREVRFSRPALVVGAIAGVFTLPIAVIGHELSEFAVIANGLRMLRA